MKEKRWKQIIQANLFISILIYLPVLIPFSTYITAYSFLFQIIVLHLLIVTVIWYSLSSIYEEKENEAP